MKRYFVITIILFFSCASQGSPSGGPPDKDGPYVIDYDFTKSKQKIEITIIFNEIIKPSSVLNSITLNGLSNFDIKIKYNKIILSANVDNESIFELNSSRNISDYQGNIMEKPIVKFFPEDQEINQNSISGNLIEIFDDKIYEVAMFSIEDSIQFFKKVEADINGNFEFSNLPIGKYRLAALEGVINNFNKDYRLKRYGIYYDDVIINEENPSSKIKIMMDNPLPRCRIIGANILSRNHAILTLSDGLEKSIYVKDSDFNGDSLKIGIKHSNRLEKYEMSPMSFIVNVPKDTIPPTLSKHNRVEDTVFFQFSEPIRFVKNDVVIRDNKNPLNYNTVDFFELSVPLIDIDEEFIYINGGSISDFSGNILDSLMAVNILDVTDLNQKFGSIQGLVEYSGESDLVVRLTNNVSSDKYHALVRSGAFKFDKVIPGEYTLDSYELKTENLDIYHSGVWEPFQKPSRFTIYPNHIDIRAHWTIEGVSIKYE